jgi:hypothetical protein
MRFVAFVIVCFIITLSQVPPEAKASPPSYYIETLGGRAKLFDETITGLLGAYDIFVSAMADPQANGDPAINLYFAAARMANILFREDESTASVRNLLKRYGIILTGDSFSSGSPDEIEISETVDSNDNVIIPEDAPDTEEVRSFLATSMISEIDGALANLAIITDTNFKAIVPYLEINSDLDLEIDYGDVLLFRAVLKTLKTLIFIATAYDMDLDPHFLVMVINSEDGNFRQILDGFQDLLKLLPTSSTPGVVGADKLSLAKTTLVAVISDYLAASNQMRNDPGTQAGAEEFFEIGNCGLREEGLFRELLIELRRSLQDTDVASLIMGLEERWVIHDDSDVNKEIEIEFWESDGDFESTNWTDRFIAWWGEVDCITEGGSTTTLYLEFWDWVDSQTCYGEATLTANSITETTVSGNYSVNYFGSTANCVGTHNGTFSGTREVAEETLNMNLNRLFDNTPDLRDMLPDFDRNGEPLAGTMGHGFGDDPTLGGILISYEKDGEVRYFTQDFWTRELDLQPGLRAMPWIPLLLLGD